MGKKVRIIISEELGGLRNLRNKEQSLKNKQKLHALCKIKEDKFATRLEVAKHLGIGKRTLERWLSIYDSGVPYSQINVYRYHPIYLLLSPISRSNKSRQRMS